MKKIIALITVLFFGVVSAFSQKDDSMWKARKFSPNGDGVNDTFVFNVVNIETISIEITDEKGIVVYKSEKLKSAWDGKDLKGKPAKAGVYSYKSNGVGKDGKKYFQDGKIILE